MVPMAATGHDPDLVLIQDLVKARFRPWLRKGILGVYVMRTVAAIALKALMMFDDTLFSDGTARLVVLNMERI
jgi:hypothetical protein